MQDWRYGQKLAEKDEARASQYNETLQVMVGELEQQKVELSALEGE